MKPKYSFCESVTATGISPWCIRELTANGRKLGGRIDSDSLCGRVKATWGWDIPVDAFPSHPMACAKCAALLNDLLIDME